MSEIQEQVKNCVDHLGIDECPRGKIHRYLGADSLDTVSITEKFGMKYQMMQ